MNHLPVQYLIGGTEKLSDAVWTLNAKTDAEDETLWLPLVVHLQDTAAVMEYLLWHWLPDDYYDELELTRRNFAKSLLQLRYCMILAKQRQCFSGRYWLTERRCGISWKKWTNYRTAEGLI